MAKKEIPSRKYDCESWTMTNKTKSKVNATEM